MTAPNLLVDSARKEQFSKAFVHAIASASGFTLIKYETDFDGIDIGLSEAHGGTIRTPYQIDAQLKCTSSRIISGSNIVYELDARNYNFLAGIFSRPRILILVVVPDDHAVWLDGKEDSAKFQYCAYWTSFSGEPKTANTSSKTIHIPRDKIFNTQNLSQMMDSVRLKGEVE